MYIFIIIVSVLIVTMLLILGRKLYQRSVRLRNQLQMGEVFMNISHELLTPLTVLSASIERLRIQEPVYKHDYDLMDINIERMVRLLQEILDTSKSLSGELKLSVAYGDVMQYIYRTALCLEPLMAKKHIRFTVDCQPKSMMGWIDTDKLDKIIYNLLSNAAKYTNEKGRVNLTAKTNSHYDRLIIDVTDTGIGISKEQMKNLFHRFYDGNYRRMHTTGNGLGLALTRDLVYLHGGTIDCDSTEGEGSMFSVVIPITKEYYSKDQLTTDYQINPDRPQILIADYDNLLPEPIVDPLESEDIENRDEDIYRILLVEDNVELLMLMQSILAQKYYVMTAHNGKEALEKVAHEDIDLVISDVMMPEMDGNQLTRTLKDDPNTSHLPVILLTAKTREEDRKESMLIGADDYVTKPFKIGDLDLRIRNIIENRKRILREFKARNAEESRLAAEKTLSPDEEFLRKAIDCVYDHLSDSDFDRDAFAAAMGASASTLYNKLRSITGMNVSAFIRDIRMKEAHKLALTRPDMRVSDLAYHVGFKDPKYFSTCFKKEFGVQPSEFIERITAP